MTRGLLGLFFVVATLTLSYGSVFALLAQIRTRFGFEDWGIGVVAVFELGGFLLGPVLASVLDAWWGLRAPWAGSSS